MFKRTLMIKDLIKLANALDRHGFKKQADLVDSILRKLAQSGLPDSEKIVSEIQGNPKFNIDDEKKIRILKFLKIKNLTYGDPTGREGEISAAVTSAKNFMDSNPDIKDGLEEADKLWKTWGSWTPSARTSGNSSNSGPMSPEEDFLNKEDQTGVHADLKGAKPGHAFSIPGIPLSSDWQPKNFYYLSPMKDDGELMDFDEFFSHYTKDAGVVPINVFQSGSVFYEQFLNTAKDIFGMNEEQVEKEVEEYIDLMKMEDAIYKNQTGESRFFAREKNPNNEMGPNEEYEHWMDEQEREERKILQAEQDRLKSLIGETKKNLLGAREQARISGKSEEELTATQAVTPGVAKNVEDLRKIISCGFGIAPDEWYKEVKSKISELTDVYNLLEYNLDGFYTIFQNNKKDWEEIAKYIAEQASDRFHNKYLFVRMRLYRIYKPEEYKFSEKALENLIEYPDGLDVFYKARVWKELPPHFIELAAEKDPYKFFNSEIFKSGVADNRAIGIASATLINSYADANLANYWLSLGISSRVPRNHFDSMVKLLAEQDPARFLAWTSKDGKRLSNFYPKEKEIAEEGLLDEAERLPHEDPITFFSPTFPGGNKLWADYHGDKEEGISIAINTAKELLKARDEEKQLSFSANWLKAGLYRFPGLDEATELAVDNFIWRLDASFEYKYGQEIPRLEDARESPEELALLKKYLDEAIKNPSEVRFYDYTDKASFPAILTGIRQYLERI